MALKRKLETVYYVIDLTNWDIGPGSHLLNGCSINTEQVEELALTDPAGVKVNLPGLDIEQHYISKGLGPSS